MTLVLLKKLQQSQQINQIPSVTITPQAAHTKDHASQLSSPLPTGKSAQPPMPNVPHHAKPPPPPLNRLVNSKLMLFHYIFALYHIIVLYSHHRRGLMCINLTSLCLQIH